MNRKLTNTLFTALFALIHLGSMEAAIYKTNLITFDVYHNVEDNDLVNHFTPGIYDFDKTGGIDALSLPLKRDFP